MQIVVCVKYVPDTAHLKYDSNNHLQQEGLDYIMNPFCEYAVETAIRLKEATEGSTVTVLSVGPASAKEAIKRALAMGCDDGYLISDESLANNDAWATAYTLFKAIQQKTPQASLILLGQLATDGMSGITGPALAELLGMPSLTFAKNLEPKTDQVITAYRETEQGVQTYELSLPGLACIMKCDYEPRIPSIKGVMKANRTDIPTLSLADIGITSDQVGTQGAYTQVADLKRKPKKQGGVKIDGADAKAAVDQLISYLKEQKVM